jgi:hypothetical protein
MSVNLSVLPGRGFLGSCTRLEITPRANNAALASAIGCSPTLCSKADARSGSYTALGVPRTICRVVKKKR